MEIKDQLSASFNDIASLLESFRSQVLPSIVLLSDDDGHSQGIGFVFGNGYMLTNAHVLTTRHLNSFLGRATRLYSRPASKYCPDFCVLTMDNQPQTSLVRVIPKSYDRCHSDVHYFMWDFSKDDMIFLTPDCQVAPMVRRFRTRDGIYPDYGSSGSPIVRAVVEWHNDSPSWDFQVVGMLYARERDDVNALMVVDLLDELGKQAFIGSKANTLSIYGEKASQAMLHDYEAHKLGYTLGLDVNIDFEQTLEWLKNSKKPRRIVELKESILAQVDKDKENKKKTDYFKSIKKELDKRDYLTTLKSMVSDFIEKRQLTILSCLKKDFDDLLTSLEITEVRRTEPRTILESDTLRVDQDGLMFSIEDNTNRILIDGVSISQLFAKAIFSKPIENGQKISPDVLRTMLRYSRESLCPIVLMVDGVDDKRKPADSERGYYLNGQDLVEYEKPHKKKRGVSR